MPTPMWFCSLARFCCFKDTIDIRRPNVHVIGMMQWRFALVAPRKVGKYGRPNIEP